MQINHTEEVPNMDEPFPQLEGTRWMYVNLAKLAVQIEIGRPIDPRLACLKNMFDVVACACSFLGERVVELLCDYFAKDGGIKLSLD